MQHQLRFVELCRTHARYGWGAEPGVGKTIGTLAMVADQKARGFVGKTAVVAPKSVLWSAWANDAQHFPSLRAIVCWATSPAKRRKLIESPEADVLVMNYETFKKHAELLAATGCRRLVIDEASKLRNRDTQISKAAWWFSTQVKSVYLLSGTPAPNGPWEYFALLRCIDPKVFGVSWWKFVNSYFCPVKKTVFVGGVAREIIIGYKFLDGAEERFTERLKTCWWSLRARDCVDLPEETDVIRQVVLGAPEQNAYLNLIEELRHEWEDGTATEVSLSARSMKLRQITGGHLYTETGYGRPVGRSKLDALLELLEELGTAQLVVWAVFTAEIDRIVEELNEKRISVAKIDGSIEAPDRAVRIAEFQAGRLRVLVCHPKAAGHGITLTAARYDCFYSLDFFPDDHDQARKRIHRVGQHWPVCHFYLVAAGTVDEKVLKVLRRKATASEALKEVLAEGREAVRA